MEFVGLFDGKQEDSDEEERKKQVKERKEASRKSRMDRLAQEEAEAENYYRKHAKPETLKTRLEYKQLMISDEKAKTSFLAQRDVIVTILDSEEFTEKMKEITTSEDLKNYFKEWYETHQLGDENKENVHNWLIEFIEVFAGAVGEMTQIPDKSEVCQTLEHAFRDLKETATQDRETAGITSSWITDQLRKKREEEDRRMMDGTVDALKAISINEAGNEQLVAEIQTIGIDSIRNPRRDTSPRRIKISEAARNQLLKNFGDHYVDMSKRKTKKKKTDENDFFFNVFTSCRNREETSDDDDIIPKILNAPNAKNQESTEPDVYDYSFSDLEDGDEVVNDPEYESVLEMKKRDPMYHENYTAARNLEEHETMRYKHRLHHNRRVKFVDYESPSNTMRIFTLPNGFLFHEGDDGPETEYVDLKLGDGWRKLRERQNPTPLTVSGEGGYEAYKKNASKRVYITVDPSEWMDNYCGNLLGRFWFANTAEYDTYGQLKGHSTETERHRARCQYGLLRQYFHSELTTVYKAALSKLHKHMRRSLSRNIEPGHKGLPNEKVTGVLILTDWRLIFLNLHVMINARVEFMPTNIGDMFFETMTEFVVQLCRDANLDFHTIIFAFGGSPTFQKASFLRFWKQLIFQTTKSIDVFWMAQDWCDGLVCSQEEIDKLNDFNGYVKKVFHTMAQTGHRNYKWFNIRELYEIGELPEMSTKEGKPNTKEALQNLYFAYVKHFAEYCNCYVRSQFFLEHDNVMDSYAENNATLPELRKRRIILPQIKEEYDSD